MAKKKLKVTRKKIVRERPDVLNEDHLRDVLLGLLAEHRTATEESLNGFADRNQIARGSIGDIVRGTRNMGLPNLIAVAHGLGQDLGSLELAAKSWRRGTRPASACFGSNAIQKAANLMYANMMREAAEAAEEKPEKITLKA